MPKRVPGRTLPYERRLATRVKIARAELGWSLEQLAKAMAEVGCPIAPSSIYKIETSDPPRTIGVNEHYAFADVLGVTPEELVDPLPVEDDEDLKVKLVDLKDAAAKARDAVRHYVDLETLIAQEHSRLEEHWPNLPATNDRLWRMWVTAAQSRGDPADTAP